MWKEIMSKNKETEKILESEYQLFEEKQLVNIINWRCQKENSHRYQPTPMSYLSQDLC